MTLVIARDRHGMLLRVADPETSVPEAYRQCIDGNHPDCPVSRGVLPTSGRCDCACHAFIAPV